MPPCESGPVLTARVGKRRAADPQPAMESNLRIGQFVSILRGRGTEGTDFMSNETAWIDRLGRRESHELSTIDKAAQRFRTGLDTVAAVRNRRPDRNLALKNHNPGGVDLQAAAARECAGLHCISRSKILPAGRANPVINAYNRHTMCPSAGGHGDVIVP